MMQKLLLLLLLGLVVPGRVLNGALAEDGADDAAAEAAVDDEEEEEDEDAEIDLDELDEEGGSSGPGIETACVFTEGSPASMPAGSQVSALVSFSNGGNRPLLIKAVKASIRDPNDFNFVFEAYPELAVGQSIEAGEQHSYMLKFTPDNGLDPRDVAMEVAIDFVDDDDEDFLTEAAFNGTVTITPSVQKMDMDQIVQLIFFVVTIFGGGYYLMNSKVGQDVIGTTGGSTNIETGTESTEVDDDWASTANSFGSPSKKGKKSKGGKK